jgi:hypothetical protein
MLAGVLLTTIFIVFEKKGAVRAPQNKIKGFMFRVLG